MDTSSVYNTVKDIMEGKAWLTMYCWLKTTLR